MVSVGNNTKGFELMLIFPQLGKLGHAGKYDSKNLGPEEQFCFQLEKLPLLLSIGLMHSHLFLSSSLPHIYISPSVFGLWQDKVFACFFTIELYLQLLVSLTSGLFPHRNYWG